MNLDQAEGKVKELKGKAKQKVGQATGGDRMTASGVKDEIAGKVQKTWGNAKDDAQHPERKPEDDQP